MSKKKKAIKVSSNVKSEKVDVISEGEIMRRMGQSQLKKRMNKEIEDLETSLDIEKVLDEVKGQSWTSSLGIASISAHTVIKKKEGMSPVVNKEEFTVIQGVRTSVSDEKKLEKRRKSLALKKKLLEDGSGELNDLAKDHINGEISRNEWGTACKRLSKLAKDGHLERTIIENECKQGKYYTWLFAAVLVSICLVMWLVP